MGREKKQEEITGRHQSMNEYKKSRCTHNYKLQKKSSVYFMILVREVEIGELVDLITWNIFQEKSLQQLGNFLSQRVRG